MRWGRQTFWGESRGGGSSNSGRGGKVFVQEKQGNEEEEEEDQGGGWHWQTCALNTAQYRCCKILPHNIKLFVTPRIPCFGHMFHL